MTKKNEVNQIFFSVFSRCFSSPGVKGVIQILILRIMSGLFNHGTIPTSLFRLKTQDFDRRHDTQHNDTQPNDTQQIKRDT